jgi:hypothetical protein
MWPKMSIYRIHVPRLPSLISPPQKNTGRCADLEAQAADAQAAADKVQRDLQDLSGAYATLEAHAAELEGRGGGGGAGEAAAAGKS